MLAYIAAPAGSYGLPINQASKAQGVCVLKHKQPLATLTCPPLGQSMLMQHPMHVTCGMMGQHRSATTQPQIQKSDAPVIVP